MAFVKNKIQQISLNDTTYGLTERSLKILKKNWAESFSKNVFLTINEERFYVLYSDNTATRPNTPVNVIVGLLFLKELHTKADDDCMESFLIAKTDCYSSHFDLSVCMNCPNRKRCGVKYQKN